MHYFKKIRNKFTLICSILFSINAFSMEQKIEISDVKLNFFDGHYFLSYHQSISLLSEARVAASKGIPFNFLATAKILQNNKYGFRKKILSKEFYFKLKYKSLLKKYMVSDIKGQKSFFDNIDDALKKLSYIKLIIGPSIELNEGTLELKTKLDKKYLPKALQINFNNKSWDVESELTRIEIGRLN